MHPRFDSDIEPPSELWIRDDFKVNGVWELRLYNSSGCGISGLHYDPLSFDAGAVGSESGSGKESGGGVSDHYISDVSDCEAPLSPTEEATSTANSTAARPSEEHTMDRTVETPGCEDLFPRSFRWWPGAGGPEWWWQ